MPDRDRDEAGRARNARPRDAAGRPLPPGKVGESRIPDELDLTPAQALVEAQRLIRADRPFAAHEVLEAMWKARRAAGAADTRMWQGLAQVCVGLTHCQRGNTAGAITLLRRGAETLEPFTSHRGIPIALVITWSRDLAGSLLSSVGTPTPHEPFPALHPGPD